MRGTSDETELDTSLRDARLKSEVPRLPDRSSAASASSRANIPKNPFRAFERDDAGHVREIRRLVRSKSRMLKCSSSDRSGT